MPFTGLKSYLRTHEKPTILPIYLCLPSNAMYVCVCKVLNVSRKVVYEWVILRKAITDMSLSYIPDEWYSSRLSGLGDCFESKKQNISSGFPLRYWFPVVRFISTTGMPLISLLTPITDIHKEAHHPHIHIHIFLYIFYLSCYLCSMTTGKVTIHISFLDNILMPNDDKLPVIHTRTNISLNRCQETKL